jgi:hypothetical protein
MRKDKLQETYDLAVREVLADLSVDDDSGDGYYVLTVDKGIYDKLLAAEYKLLAYKEEEYK